ncbi:MAG: hypothetical protein R3A43_12590 [Bacteroidia bacterium]
MEYLKMYSGFVHLDFDKLSPDELLAQPNHILLRNAYHFCLFHKPKR